MSNRNDWICSACTLSNPSARTVCSVCGTLKPAAAATVPTSAAPINPSRTTSGPAASTTTPNNGPVQPVRSNTSGGGVGTLAQLPTASNTANYNYKPTESDITFFYQMGFDRESSINALKLNNGDRDSALDYLLSTPQPQTQSQSQSQKTNTAKSTPAVSTVPVPASTKPTIATMPNTNKPTSTATTVKPTVNSTSAAKPTTATATATSTQAPAIKPAAVVAKSTSTPAVATNSTVKPTTTTVTIKPTPVPVPVPVSAPAKLSATEQKAAQKAAEAREAERARLAAELEQKELQLKEKERLMRQEAAEELKARRLAAIEEKKLASIEKDKAAESARQSELIERRDRRFKLESTIPDIPTALQYIKDNYDTERYQSLIELLIKILTNILSDPKNDRFRTIKTSSDKIQRYIIRPLGGSIIMRCLGFNIIENSINNEIESFYMPIESINSKLLTTELNRFKSVNKTIQSNIPIIFQSIKSNSNYSIESIYYAAIEFRNILHNVITAPEEWNFRSIDLHSRSYIKRIKPINELVELLTEYQFKPEPNNVYLIIDPSDINIPLFESAVIDLNKEIAKLAIVNPIYQYLYQLFQYYSIDNIDIPSSERKLFNLLFPIYIQQYIGLINKIIEFPLEEKYLKINLNKFYNRILTIIDRPAIQLIPESIIEQFNKLFFLFEFTINPDTNIAQLPPHPQYDPELLKLRKNELNRALKELKPDQ